MGSFTLTNVFPSGPTFGGCGPKSITCFGSAKHLAVFEETALAGTLQPQRQIHTVDDGRTWTEWEPYWSTNSLWFGPSTSPATNTILVGTIGPNSLSLPEGDDVAVARSTDGSVTWSSPLAGVFAPATDTWDTDMLVSGANGRVLAGGWYNIGTGYYNLLLSDDYGETFPVRLGMTAGEMDPAHLSCGVHLGNGVILLGSEGAVYNVSGWIAGHPVWRSADNGDTWTRIQLVSTDYDEDESYRFGMTHFAHCGGNTVVGCSEGYDGDGNALPLCWISHDLGVTWDELSANLASVWGDGQVVHWPKLMAGWNDGQYLVMLISRQGDTVPAAVFSEDTGATWSAATIPATEDGQEELELLWANTTKADDGAVLATLGRLTDDIGGDTYPPYHLLLGATSGDNVTLTANGPLWPDPETAMLQHIKFVAGGEVIVVGWFSVTQVWVDFVTSPGSVGPYAPNAWYIRSATRNHWDIWRGVPSWPAGVGPCYVAPVPPAEHNFARVPTFHPWATCPQECGL